MMDFLTVLFLLSLFAAGSPDDSTTSGPDPPGNSTIWTGDGEQVRRGGMSSEFLRFMGIMEGTHFQGLLVLGIVAILTNSLNLSVMRRQPEVSPYTYLSVLAACDLATGFAMMWIALFYSRTMNRISDIVGLILQPTFVPFYYLRDSCSLAATFLTTALSVDRLVAVKFPLKRHLWCTVKKARILSACFVVTSFIIKSHQLLRLTITRAIPDYLTGRDLPLVSYTSIGMNPTVNKIVLFVTLSIEMLCPLFVMLVSNSLTLQQVARSRKFRSEAGASGQEGRSSGSDGAGQCQAISIGVIMAFIVFSTPRISYWLLTVIDGGWRTQSNYDAQTGMVFAEFFAWSTACCNFFIYCVMNPKFRGDIAKMLSCGMSGPEKAPPLEAIPTCTHLRPSDK